MKDYPDEFQPFRFGRSSRPIVYSGFLVSWAIQTSNMHPGVVINLSDIALLDPLLFGHQFWVQLDNATSVAYINHQEGTRSVVKGIEVCSVQGGA